MSIGRMGRKWGEGKRGRTYALLRPLTGEGDDPIVRVITQGDTEMATTYTPTQAEKDRAELELQKLEAGAAAAPEGMSIRITASRFERPSPGIPTYWYCWIERETSRAGKPGVTKICYSLSHTGRCVNVGDPKDNVFAWDGPDQTSYSVL